MKQKAKEFEKEYVALLAKFNFKLITELKFPQYNMLPPEVVLALKVIENHGGQLTSTFVKNEDPDLATNKHDKK